MIDTVIQGDALSVLREMADNSVDSIVTDPPCGISFMSAKWDTFDDKTHRSRQSEKDAAEENGRWLEGRGTLPYSFSPDAGRTKKERENFIHFLREVMTEALRVLRPGGHALVWALPRTSHWTATALEDAGFEIRDTITHIFGSGFPKSLDISKAIDRMQGAEREVIRTRTLKDMRRNVAQDMAEGRGNQGKYAAGTGPTKNMEYDYTKPATPEAQQWAGYGSALKPACEFWWLCRKPLAESSIAANVLAWGTGGINVDACRVAHNDRVQCQTGGVNSLFFKDGNYEGKGREYTTQGRFPSHLLLSHSLWCVPQGVKRVRANGGENGNNLPRKQGATYKPGDVRIGTTYRDQDGMELVEAYLCADDCPIAELDRQSGVRKSGGGVKAKAGSSIGFLRGEDAYHFRHDNPTSYEPSEGGASRYFQHFPPDDYTPFLYTSKASRRERNQGCEGLPEASPWTSFDGQYAKGRNPVTGERSEHEYKREQSNSHPTVKPLALMRWLIRLITPPNGVVLDCFAGSGSTLVAAIQEGMHFIGIEQDESYVNIANARIAHERQPDSLFADCDEEVAI